MVLETYLDRYFRRKDTILARSLRRISPKMGVEYRKSRVKRVSDIATALPLAVLSYPIVRYARWASRRQTKLNPIYTQERVLGPSFTKEYETFTTRKIRTMRAGSDAKNIFGSTVYFGEEDPRVVKIGKKIRPIRLDEYPQLWQVVRGEMSLVGIRAIHPYDWERLSKKTSDGFEDWKRAYFEGKPSFISMHKTIGEDNGDNTMRYPWDIRYAKEANLGMDLYLFYRTMINTLVRNRRKSHKQTKN